MTTKEFREKFDGLYEDYQSKYLNEAMKNIVKEHYYNQMKPIEKYQAKFIELLKEMEEELGPGLEVKVASRLQEKEDKSTYFGVDQHIKKYETVYKFGVQTTGFYL